MEHDGPTVNNPRQLFADRCHGIPWLSPASCAERCPPTHRRSCRGSSRSACGNAMVETMGFFAVLKPGLGPHHPWRNRGQGDLCTLILRDD